MRHEVPLGPYPSGTDRVLPSADVARAFPAERSVNGA